MHWLKIRGYSVSFSLSLAILKTSKQHIYLLCYLIIVIFILYAYMYCTQLDGSHCELNWPRHDAWINRQQIQFKWWKKRENKAARKGDKIRKMNDKSVQLSPLISLFAPHEMTNQLAYLHSDFFCSFCCLDHGASSQCTQLLNAIAFLIFHLYDGYKLDLLRHQLNWKCYFFERLIHKHICLYLTVFFTTK